MIEFCVGRLLELQASVTAMTVTIGNDLTMLLEASQDEAIDPKELKDSYQQTRRAALKELLRELQERFPPRQA